jgi:hypothetical protein
VRPADAYGCCMSPRASETPSESRIASSDRATRRKPSAQRAAEAIENAESIDPLVGRVNAAVRRLLPPGRLRDVLRGAPIGHPLHPVAILVPAGAWICSAVLDLIPGSRRASQTLIGVGLLSALPAVSAGIADWSALDSKQQRVGVVHGTANLTAIALYSASYVMRRRGKMTAGKMLGFLGIAVFSASGYLGTHLAYRQGANVAHTSGTTTDDALVAGSD